MEIADRLILRKKKLILRKIKLSCYDDLKPIRELKITKNNFNNFQESRAREGNSTRNLVHSPAYTDNDKKKCSAPSCIDLIILVR